VTLHFLSGFRVKKKETRADCRDITNHAPLPIPSRRKPPQAGPREKPKP